MPSHISHALLVDRVVAIVEEVSGRTIIEPSRPSDRWGARYRTLVLGAQGPDPFLHNHRRKPRGFRYGAILHRKGSAALLAHLAAALRERGGSEGHAGGLFPPGAHAAPTAPATPDAPPSPTATGSIAAERRALILAWSVGYITHVWLDRIVHPYINVHAGWRGVPDSHPDRPAMHAFLERLIDVQLLSHLRGQSVAEYAFLERVRLGSRELWPVGHAVSAALRAALSSASGDAELAHRLLNAFRDSRGFWEFTEAPTRAYFRRARQAERDGAIDRRWLSLVHPPPEAIPFDVLNLERRRWSHPCDGRLRFTDSVPALFERAVERSVRSVLVWLAAAGVATRTQATHHDAVLADIGDANLNDGLTGDPPCRRAVATPLPLIDLYDDLKSSLG